MAGPIFITARTEVITVWVGQKCRASQGALLLDLMLRVQFFGHGGDWTSQMRHPLPLCFCCVLAQLESLSFGGIRGSDRAWSAVCSDWRTYWLQLLKQMKHSYTHHERCVIWSIVPDTHRSRFMEQVAF